MAAGLMKRKERPSQAADLTLTLTLALALTLTLTSPYLEPSLDSILSPILTLARRWSDTRTMADASSGRRGLGVGLRWSGLGRFPT